MSEAKTKNCQNCNNEFRIEPEDFEFYEKMKVPEPTFCPDCRIQRRLIYWNDLKLYKGRDCFSGEEIFTEFSPVSPQKYCDKDFYNSDKWDPMDYAREYNFDRPFFEQMKEMSFEVPRPNFTGINMINCDYCKNVGDVKNCYMTFSAMEAENCYYCYRVHNSKDSVDCMHLNDSELCHQTFMTFGCYKAYFSAHCQDCREIFFCQNCINCSNCFGCTNLKHKKYYIFNKAYSKKEYFEKLKELNVDSYKIVEQIKTKTTKQHLKYPKKFVFGKHNVNTIGEYIDNSKNVFDSYSIRNGEDLKFCQFLDTKYFKSDTYDSAGYGVDMQNIYECFAVGGGVHNLKFCWHCFDHSTDSEYSINCESSSDVFGCVALRHKQYCILNKQYSKEDYEKMIPRIKKHMDDMPHTDSQGNVYKYGEFFPPEMSPFIYNETIANEFFPLAKEEALKQGYTWYDKSKNEYKPTIKAQDLPDHIKEVKNSILDEVIECDNEIDNKCHSSGVFKIVSAELKFYQKYDLPLPRLCPECRHHERIKLRNPMKLYERGCMCEGEHSKDKIYTNVAKKHSSHTEDQPCPNKFQTTYSPERKEIIYCEDCYQRETE